MGGPVSKNSLLAPTETAFIRITSYNVCYTKLLRVIARRVGMELAHLHPRPPAIRVFDAGMGDGTVLTRVMREMHRRFPTMPFYFVGKEISLEDVRLSLAKMADRLFEHPATVLVVTNMYYSEAPWLAPKALAAATSLRITSYNVCYTKLLRATAGTTLPTACAR